MCVFEPENLKIDFAQLFFHHFAPETLTRLYVMAT